MHECKDFFVVSQKKLTFVPMIEIQSAEFKISSPRADMCPGSRLPEYAFIGRSNVGKSSLINMLTGNKKLAMTSSMPGKTLLINHYLITTKTQHQNPQNHQNHQNPHNPHNPQNSSNWYLVDLPGYGYAQRGKKEMQKLSNMINHYVLERQQLTCLFLLIDIRLTPQKKDLEFIEFLGENQVPFAIVFTKADKLGGQKVQANSQAFLDTIRPQWEELPPHFITSSTTRTGRDEILQYIEQCNTTWATDNI